MVASEQLSLGLMSESVDSAAGMVGLPDGWRLMRLGALVTMTGGGTPSKNNSAYWGGTITWVSPKDMKTSELFDTQDHITETASAQSATKLIAPGAVLVVFRSGILAHSLPVSINRVAVTLNQDMKALTPCSEITSEFLAYFLRSAQRAILAHTQKQGATVQSIDADKFSRILLPVPPLAEQRRIVARIEELAARIEQARGLRREAVYDVDMALSQGTAEFFPSAIDETWRELAHIVDHIENGWSPKCLPEPAGEGEWGVLKVGAVSSGRFMAHENKRLPSELTPRPELAVRPGDFLMGRANTAELTGACAIAIDPPPRLMLCDKIFRLHFKPGAEVDTRYLDYTLKSKPLRAQIEAGATGTSSSMKNISKEKVMRLRLPLPPLSEQQRIACHLDGLHAKSEQLLRLQIMNTAELNALMPTLLNRAFQGEL